MFSNTTIARLKRPLQNLIDQVINAGLIVLVGGSIAVALAVGTPMSAGGSQISMATSEWRSLFDHKLIDMRYRKKPTIITTNLSFDEWYDVFKQKSLVDALLDRLKHYCTVIKIAGKSLRDPTKDETVKSKNIKQSKKS